MKKQKKFFPNFNKNCNFDNKNHSVEENTLHIIGCDDHSFAENQCRFRSMR
jgi:hypothetical protein